MARQTEYDAIVIGVGGMGSAAVYHLAKRGVDVLGIEQYDVPHSRGSSHGDTRMFRITQNSHPNYVPLAQRAGELWRELEADSGQEILTVNGSIHAGPPESSKFVGGLESLEAHDVPHEVLTGEEINERFPGYKLPAHYRGVYQPDGGFVASERAITAHVMQAQAAGGTVQARESVLNWEPLESGVRVETNRDTYKADHLVVTAGAWASKHVDLLSDALKPQRRVMAWLQPTDLSKYQPENFPTFSIDTPEGTTYGFPVYERPGFKFGRGPNDTETIDPDDWQDEPTLQDEELLRLIPENYFPDAAGPTMRLATCMITRSLDGHFYLDTHPDYPHVSIAAGFTGSGYKFCSVVGETLADFVTTGDSANVLDMFQLEGRV